ncbi:MAG: peptidoglycan-binding domain-containing protein [Candidatus Electryonea clarkiae]|nr:peptidoglycan-binding domain-containing protein [Candidatus Electryonea clarkiae]MDP8286209.1 peptidoglycan-binding domain-containing protein [Candidatus Electryonea clarkiae]
MLINNYKIRSVQKALISIGYNPGPVDGILGNRTRQAVRHFQSDHGLFSDGIPGEITRYTLATLLRERGSEFPPEIEEPVKPTFREVEIEYHTLSEIVRNRGFPWAIENDWINLVGIRGFHQGNVVENRFDFYNDTILVAINQPESLETSPQELHQNRLISFVASVDPGRLRVPNPKGVAHLETGFYRYQAGKHRGREPALVQAGPVTVLRYFDDTPRSMIPVKETGWFGINIHKGGSGENVGGWSAGCQVVRGDLWNSIIAIIKEASEKGQKIFGYTLIESSELPILPDLKEQGH